MAAPTVAEPAAEARLDRRLVALLAVACGATVANLYYAQPLLHTISRAFGISEGAAGLLVTVSQVFYAAGLALIVPLGDLVDRRALVTRLLLVCTAGLALAAAAPQVAVLALAIAIVSISSVVVQILVPFASTLAPPHERGRVVGTVMSGLLTGILIARTVSGLLAGVAGWRTPFAVAAVAMAVLAVTLRRVLPDVAPTVTIGYRRLLASIAALVREEPRLRRRMAYSACGFAGFSIVWTAVAFLLAGAPYDYGPETIGLFGLAGLVGAAGAQGSGRLTDRGLGHPATGVFLLVILASWAVLYLGRTHLLAIILGLALLDFGVQGQNVLSQGVIYALRPGIASRVTSAYVVATFGGGAIGSAAASVAWSAGGWHAVCLAGAAVGAVAFLLWITERG
jgi:predicted MFS family arabinose efflux permease